jgi:hypothetical protein
MVARDSAFAAEHAYPFVLTCRTCAMPWAQPGWNLRLADMLKAGAALPGIALAHDAFGPEEAAKAMASSPVPLASSPQ